MLAILLLGSGVVAGQAAAEDKHVADAPAGVPDAAARPQKPEKTDNALIAELPSDSVTHHDITMGGHRLAYTATAGTLTLRDDKGEPSAKVFYVAYVADGQQAEHRPVSFFFNGGPGAGSAFLHLGAAGPMVLNFPTSNPTDGANAVLQPNPDSWLRFTDTVFIDAIGYRL